MQLSSIGEIANECWSQIPEHFTFVKLGAFIVMPNHVHGIIIIDKPAVPPVQTQNIASLPGNKFGPQSQNLASIVRGFKISVPKTPGNMGRTWRRKILRLYHLNGNRGFMTILSATGDHSTPYPNTL